MKALHKKNTWNFDPSKLVEATHQLVSNLNFPVGMFVASSFHSRVTSSVDIRFGQSLLRWSLDTSLQAIGEMRD